MKEQQLTENQIKVLEAIQNALDDHIFIYRGVPNSPQDEFTVYVNCRPTVLVGPTVGDLDYLHKEGFLLELPSTQDLQHSTSLIISTKGLEAIGKEFQDNG